MNFTFKNRDEMCNMAYHLKKDRLLLGMVAAQAFLSVGSVVFLMLCLKCKRIRHIYSIINTDLKILVFVGFAFYFIGSFNSSITYVYKLILLLLYLSPCSYVWSGLKCFWANNLYSIICTVAYALFHLALLLERLWVTCTIWKCNGLFGSLLGFLILFLSCLPQILMYNHDAINYDRVYCAYVTATTLNQAQSSGISIIVLDFTVTLADFLLLIYNKYQIKKYKKRTNFFDLQRSFELRELKISIQVLFPFSLVHSLTYSLQFFAGFNYNEELSTASIEMVFFNGELVNFSRIFANFVCIGFFWIYNQARSQESNVLWVEKPDHERHFREFERIIA